MGDADDFTFCQVASQVDDEVLSLPESIPNINSISLNDSAVNGETERKINASVRKYSGAGGSQPNKIYDVSPQTIDANISPTQTAEERSGDLLSGSLEQKLANKKPIVRSKVPFEKGYSQMDWLKLTRTEPDLAGLKGQTSRRFISMDEVRKHKTEGSIWTVLKGVDMLMKAAGKDCTSLFNKYHAWVNAEFLLEKCLVGILDEN